MTTGSPVPRGAGRLYPVDPPQNVAPAFADDAISLDTLTIALDVAASCKRVKLTGNFLYAITASSLAATITINYNDQAGDGIPFSQGQFVGGNRFDELFITHAAQAGQFITLMYGAAPFMPFNVVNPLSAASTVTVTKNATFTTTADLSIATVTTSVVLAADATRRFAILSNPPTNPREFRVGDAGAAAAEGLILMPGERIQLETSAPISAFNPHIAAMSIARASILD